ncbi:hypothetical protein GCM10010346_66450 [Streptomyces chryseus]|uniref:Uncharacterized protein n=1 Tax=Streptomyces chryseus TaxID=68186 RepID=A0ABQ3ED16_9ACTN|nr:hypothetical protein GCM10010346_66450 [Streptomyces chryseus]
MDTSLEPLDGTVELARRAGMAIPAGEPSWSGDAVSMRLEHGAHTLTVYRRISPNRGGTGHRLVCHGSVF